MVRFYCVVAPGELGDLGYAYLRALADAGVKVRGLPLSAAAGMAVERRWWDLKALFTVPLEVPYINVICTRPGGTMGVRAQVGTLGTKDDLPDDLPPELRRVMVGNALKASKSRIVYDPKPVLTGMLTVGCKNVAIITANPRPTPDELVALGKYDLVICPTGHDQEQLAELGVTAQLIPIHALTGLERGGDPYRALSEAGRADLVVAFGRLCASGTTLTMVPSAATAGPRGTISPPLTSTPTTSSSRSSASIRTSRAPKISTPTSTDFASDDSAPCPTEPPGTARRMWRSITRLLGF